MQNTLYRLSVASLVCIYLVIVAGSIVRMSGSGMGCPDWPKCFGYYIPPTDVETLTWAEGKTFDSGNIIIREEALWVSNRTFESGSEFHSENWDLYTKHDYAKFNPVHTWVEYFNRLTGALSGVPVLSLFIVAMFSFRRRKVIVLLSFLGVLLLGFEAWLGKVVVEGFLIPHQISYHMFGAIALVGLYVYLVVVLKPKKELNFQAKRDKQIMAIGILAVIILSFQIYFGTAVREQVDAIGKANLLAATEWIEGLGIIFKIHRTFSLLVLGVISLFAIKVIRARAVSTWPRILLVTVFLEVFCGMGLAYLEMPRILQPIHLLLAIVDIGIILFILFDYYRKTNRISSAR